MGASVAGRPAQTAVAAGGEVVLRTEGLTKRFGNQLAVDRLNLEVHRGDVYGLLGPNGSGKTTTLRMILGLVWPTAGEIVLFGERMVDGASRQAVLHRVGAIVEQPAFYPYLSGRENLRGIATFAGLANDAATRSRVEAVLAQVGLLDRARDAYKKYSLGMKQRLGIAAALLTNPELIVLDEPTNGLDPAGMVEVRALISHLAQQGTTVLLSSHLLYEVQQVCTRVGILKQGALLAQGEVNALLAAQGGIQLGFASAEAVPRAAGVVQAAVGPQMPWLHGWQYVLPEQGAWVPPGGWLLLVDAPWEHAAEVNALLGAQGIYAAEVRRREASLEQYFLQLTSGGSPSAPAAPAAPAPAAPTMPAGTADPMSQTLPQGGQA